MLKVGALTKKRDACYWVRVLNPFSHLNLNGHSCKDEEFEKILYCANCKIQMVVSYREYDDDILCGFCNGGLISRSDLNAWADNVDKIIEESDIVCFQRPIETEHLMLMKRAKKMGKIVTQMCDDDYINVPPWNTGYQHYKDRKDIIEETLRICHSIDVTTKGLKELYSKYCNHIAILPNSQDIELIDCTPPLPEFKVYDKFDQPIESAQFKALRENKKVFLWGGSPTHEKDIELIVGPFRRITRSEDAILLMVGYKHRALLEQIPRDRLFFCGIVPNSVYFMLYKAIKADFGLAPVVDVPFNTKGKSSNKAVEYQILNVLPIMSDIETYQGCSPRGLYTKNEEYNWYRTIKDACRMDDREYIQRTSENRKYVEENFDIKKNYKLWEAYYNELMEMKK